MGMAKHDQIVAGINLAAGPGAVIGVIMVLVPRRFAAEMRTEEGEGDAQIGVEQPVAGDGGGMAQHPLHQTVEMVPGHEAVAMAEKDPPAGLEQEEPLLMQGDPRLLAKKRAHPKVVVAGEVIDRNPGIDQISELDEDAEMAAGDDVAVFEPEIEQIAAENQLAVAPAVQRAPERDQPIVFFLLARRLLGAEMGIAEQINRGARLARRALRLQGNPLL